MLRSLALLCGAGRLPTEQRPAGPSDAAAATQQSPHIPPSGDTAQSPYSMRACTGWRAAVAPSPAGCARPASSSMSITHTAFEPTALAARRVRTGNRGEDGPRLGSSSAGADGAAVGGYNSDAQQHTSAALPSPTRKKLSIHHFFSECPATTLARAALRGDARDGTAIAALRTDRRHVHQPRERRPDRKGLPAGAHRRVNIIT